MTIDGWVDQFTKKGGGGGPKLEILGKSFQNWFAYKTNILFCFQEWIENDSRIMNRIDS